MSLLMNALINLLYLLRNARRAFRRPPDFVWISMTGALPEFEPSRRGLLRRRLDPRTPPPSLARIRSYLDRPLGARPAPPSPRPPAPAPEPRKHPVVPRPHPRRRARPRCDPPRREPRCRVGNSRRVARRTIPIQGER